MTGNRASAWANGGDHHRFGPLTRISASLIERELGVTVVSRDSALKISGEDPRVSCAPPSERWKA